MYHDDAENPHRASSITPDTLVLCPISSSTSSEPRPPPFAIASPHRLPLFSNSAPSPPPFGLTLHSSLPTQNLQFSAPSPQTLTAIRLAISILTAKACARVHTRSCWFANFTISVGLAAIKWLGRHSIFASVKDVSERYGFVVLKDEVGPKEDPDANRRRFLVGCGEEVLLLLFVRSEKNKCKVVVYQLDSEEEERWVEKENLGDWCLFIDVVSNSRIACSDPARWGGRSNCVYVVEPGCDTFSVLPLDGPEIKRVDAESALCLAYKKLAVWPSPVWVYPNRSIWLGGRQSLEVEASYLQQCNCFFRFLTDNTDFNVVGIIGPTGVGKSTILNELYGFDGSSPGMLPPFATQSEETIAMAKHCTAGVELRVSSERLILLDAQPMFSPSVLVDMMRPDGLSTISVLNGESLSADLAHELLGIQIGVFLLSVCNVLLVASEGIYDFSMWKLMLTVDLLKHDIPDPSMLTSAQSQASTTGAEKDNKVNQQLTNEEHLAAPVFIHTK
ncbi:uncharacterized protein A4U43_C08F1200 [Asparagus officinalis]|nr:uncharacterized protein A4U43_C08F1200 [Asparagus officinalis]